MNDNIDTQRDQDFKLIREDVELKMVLATEQGMEDVELVVNTKEASLIVQAIDAMLGI